MAESRANVESNDTMIRITALGIAHQNECIEFASRIARHRSGRPRVGVLRKILGCLPHAVPIFRSSYRKNKRKLISDPRLQHILDRLVISVIRKVEEAEPSITSFTPIKEPVISLRRPISKGSSLKSVDLEHEHECSLTDDDDDDADEKDEREDFDKFSIPHQKGKRMSEEDLDCTAAKFVEERPTVVPAKGKVSMNAAKKEIQPKSNILENRECPICWEPYQVGQKICWSPNKKCSHAFHADCMIMWLMKKDDCPMCRSNYLRVKCGGSL